MHHSRRNLLLALGGAVAACSPVVAGKAFALSAAPAASAAAPAVIRGLATAPAEVRRVLVHNTHTGDKLDAVYFERGKYVPDALAEAMRVMRDWRNGEEHVIDPRLFDVLHDIRGKLEVDAPFQIISAYRSPATNAMLHAHSDGVASHSQHMLGKASDIRIQGVEVARIHKAALSLAAGGVGLYPVSNFVHVDVGPVRQWTGV